MDYSDFRTLQSRLNIDDETLLTYHRFLAHPHLYTEEYDTDRHFVNPSITPHRRLTCFFPPHIPTLNLYELRNRLTEAKIFTYCTAYNHDLIDQGIIILYFNPYQSCDCSKTLEIIEETVYYFIVKFLGETAVEQLLQLPDPV